MMTITWVDIWVMSRAVPVVVLDGEIAEAFLRLHASERIPPMWQGSIRTRRDPPHAEIGLALADNSDLLLGEESEDR